MNLSDTLIAAAATAAGPAPEDLEGDKFTGWKGRVVTIAASLSNLAVEAAKVLPLPFPEGTTDHSHFDWNDVTIVRVEEFGNSKRLKVYFDCPEHLRGKFTAKDGTENVNTLRSFEEGGEAQQALVKSLVGKKASFTKLSFKEDGEKRNVLANLRPSGESAPAPAADEAPAPAEENSDAKAAERQRKADEANAAEAVQEAAEDAGLSIEDALALDAEQLDLTYDGIVTHAKAINVDRGTLRELATETGVTKHNMDDEKVMLGLATALVQKGRELAKAGAGTLPEAPDEVF